MTDPIPTQPVQRYKLTTSTRWDADRGACIIPDTRPDPDGAYVLHAALAAVEAERDALSSQITMLGKETQIAMDMMAEQCRQANNRQYSAEDERDALRAENGRMRELLARAGEVLTGEGHGSLAAECLALTPPAERKAT